MQLLRVTSVILLAAAVLGGAVPTSATVAVPERGATHPVRGPAIQRGISMGLSDQMPATKLAGQRAASTAGNGMAGIAPFMTRPYWDPHVVTSVFDHCNPNYTHDGEVCEFDGTVGLRSNGPDPTFPYGYAVTPGGTDYLYYDGHDGWDLALSYETVLAAAPGSVYFAGYSSAGWGNEIIIDHPNGLSTKYAHLSEIDVQAGQQVARGQRIGISGNTGQSTGPHLHFGVYRNDPWTPIDPWGWSGATSDPWPSDLGNLWFTGNPQNPAPWAPTGLAATAIVGGASLSWKAPAFDGGEPINSYTVVSTPDSITTTTPAGVTSANVTGLRAGVSYTFTVAAESGLGSSPASAASNPVQPIAAINGKWESLKGSWASSPAVASWANGRLDLFEIGNDQALWHTWWNGSTWSSWESLGGTLTGDPAVASWSAGRLDVFASGADRTLWHRWWDGVSWSPWESLGGVLSAGPGVAAWSPNRLDVFVNGADRQLWHRWWDGTRWNGWEPLGGVLSSDLAAASRAPGQVDVFGRGSDDALWHRWWDGSRWHAWESLAGVLAAAPAAEVQSNGQLDIFVTGSDQALWRKSWTGVWSAWQPWGGTWTSGPAAASQSAGNIDLFERGSDLAPWHTLITAS